MTLLRRDPIDCAYMIGELGAGHRDAGTWYAAGAASALEGVMLVYEGLSLPVVITYGQSGAIEDIANTFHRDLPGRTMVHLPPHHIAALDRYYGTASLVPTLRMGLAGEEFRGAPRSRWEVEPMSHRDTGDIMGLQAHYDESFFEPSQLGSGHYYGIRVDGKLVSVAGVHVYSREHSIACLGNIVTHPGWRGQGLSTACTSHLIAQLLREGVRTLALNVRRRNVKAVRIYERLGFRYHDTFLEGLVSYVHESGP